MPFGQAEGRRIASPAESCLLLRTELDREGCAEQRPLMRMENLERRAAPSSGACVVCNCTDARVLSFTRLMDGERVTVCGSHKIAHRRSETIARTIEELRQLTGERRKSA